MHSDCKSIAVGRDRDGGMGAVQFKATDVMFSKELFVIIAEDPMGMCIVEKILVPYIPAVFLQQPTKIQSD